MYPMALSSLTAISPIDGRYYSKTSELSVYFSELALFRYRVLVEVEYFIALCELPLPALKDVKPVDFKNLRKLAQRFSLQNGNQIKDIEKVTNHDVKAVEYYLKEKFDELGLKRFKEFIHFGLTSQDVNNTAMPLMIKKSLENIYLPQIQNIIKVIDDRAKKWDKIPMLARTHGQPASPTRLGKEMAVFSKRLKNQLALLEKIPIAAKFGGATGNFNAHHVAFPEIDWNNFANNFIKNLGLQRLYPTTQIEHYDYLSAMFDALKRINTILIDFSRDIWLYISMAYFNQKIVKGEVGSSAMPHKVNPIDFENAEGNFSLANAILEHLSAKLPISRLQRDLTDSTVSRNFGVPIAHTIIAFQSLLKGIDKLIVNKEKIFQDLEDNWVVVSEAIQTVLRREGVVKPYELLKDLTRKNEKITKEMVWTFIDNLQISSAVKKELKSITPFNYVGI